MEQSDVLQFGLSLQKSLVVVARRPKDYRHRRFLWVTRYQDEVIEARAQVHGPGSQRMGSRSSARGEENIAVCRAT